MDERLFLDGPTALDCWRRLRSSRLTDCTKPARIRSLAGCAHSRRSIERIIDDAGPLMRHVLPSMPTYSSAVDDRARCESFFIAVDSPRRRSKAQGVISRVCTAAPAPRSYRQLTDRVFIPTPEECFLQVAPMLSDARRLLLAMELAGTYCLDPEGRAYRFDVPSVVSIKSLADHCSSRNPSNGSALCKATRILSWAIDRSASPMETALAALLVLPYRYGGYGIPIPRMNVPLDQAGRIVAPNTPGSRRPDIVWLDHMLVLEYNGRDAHCGIDDYERDSDRRDELERLGYRVIPVSAPKLYDTRRFHELATTVAKHTGKRVQLPKGFGERRDQLRSQVLPRLRANV